MQKLRTWIQIVDNKVGLEFSEDIWYRDLIGAVFPVDMPYYLANEWYDKCRWKTPCGFIFVEDTKVLSVKLDGKELVENGRK